MDRARRIIAQAAGVPYERAGELLAESGKQRAYRDRDGARPASSRERSANAGWRRAGGRISRGSPNMDKFVINGRRAAYRARSPTSGSKNSALPALAAALLTDEPVTLHRIPRVRDIRTMQRLLVDIGATVEVERRDRPAAHASGSSARKRRTSW